MSSSYLNKRENIGLNKKLGVESLHHAYQQFSKESEILQQQVKEMQVGYVQKGL